MLINQRGVIKSHRRIESDLEFQIPVFSEWERSRTELWYEMAEVRTDFDMYINQSTSALDSFNIPTMVNTRQTPVSNLPPFTQCATPISSSEPCSYPQPHSGALHTPVQQPTPTRKSAPTTRSPSRLPLPTWSFNLHWSSRTTTT